MFSYRHAFHVGNHADVLKHCVLVHILDYFNRKESPYWVIDTHAGAGVYDLTSEWAMEGGEFVDGLDRLLGSQEKPILVQRYLEAIQQFNPDGVANIYPGSPWLALSAMRDKDRLRLFEMHPTEVDVLRQNLRQLEKTDQRQVAVYEEDGFNGLKALLPPPTRRGIVLIDPSYENKQDYRYVLNAIEEGLKRFATGCFVVWYPLVQRREVAELTRALEKLAVPWLNATLSVRRPPKDGYGLYGSGMFVINPPYTLHQALNPALPWLKQTLAQDDRAAYTLKGSDEQKPGPDKSDGSPARPARPGKRRATR